MADAEPLAQQVAKRPVRERFAVGDAAALEPQGRRRGGRLRNLEDAVQLVQQPALADARLARDEEKAARAAQRTFERKLGQVELPLSADEARLDPFEPTDLLPLREHTLDGRRPHRLCLPFQLQLDWLRQREQRLGLPPRRVVDKRRPRLRPRLKSGGGVDRVAEGGVLGPAAAADLAEDDGAGRDPDPDIELGDPPAPLDLRAVGGDLLDDAQRRSERAFRIVLVRNRRAEEGEDTVSGEVLDVAADPLHLGDDSGHRLPDDELDFFCVELLAECGRTDEVGEENGDDLPLLAEIVRRRR